jgi:type IV pilus assembly protein PilX
MRNRSFMKRATTQRGAVLVVSLLLLLVMTVLGLGASQSTRLQERMAGNQRDVEVAMQSAEASLRAAELLLAPNQIVTTCGAPDPNCEAYQMNTLVTNGVALDLAKQSNDWWQQFGRTYQFSTTLEVARAPEFVVERVAESRDTLSVGDSELNIVRDFFRATARSSGTTNTAQVVVQSTYSRVDFE